MLCVESEGAGRRPVCRGAASLVLLLWALAARPLAAQATPELTRLPASEPAAGRIEPLADPARLAPATVGYVHPLYRPIDTPAKAIERPAPEDITTRTTLMVTIHLLQNGTVADAIAVEPPLRGLMAPLSVVAPRWKFTPAQKEGRPVATWATLGIELELELEKAFFGSFELRPVGKDDPLLALAKEPAGDAWMSRYPKEVAPPDPTVVSIEDVDALPSPEKAKWSFDAARLRSRVTAFVEITASGAVRRFVPTGSSTEPVLVAWVRRAVPRWRFLPAVVKGNPTDSWMHLDTMLEYTVSSAKDKGKRSLKKNLRATPSE